MMAMVSDPKKQIFGEDQAEGLRKLFNTQIGTMVAVLDATASPLTDQVVATLSQRLVAQGRLSVCAPSAHLHQMQQWRSTGHIALVREYDLLKMGNFDLSLVIIDGRQEGTIVSGANLIQKLVQENHPTAVLLNQASGEIAQRLHTAIERFTTEHQTTPVLWLGHIPTPNARRTDFRMDAAMAADACARRLAQYVEKL